jgi:hypothetical protein
MLNDHGGSYYKAEPEVKFFFPLALILAVDDDGIIREELKGNQTKQAICELLELSRKEEER